MFGFIKRLFASRPPLTQWERECTPSFGMKGGQNPPPTGILIRPPAPGGSGGGGRAKVSTKYRIDFINDGAELSESAVLLTIADEDVRVLPIATGEQADFICSNPEIVRRLRRLVDDANRGSGVR